MVQCINPARIAPVTEDLTQPYDDFQVLRGWEKMNRVDKPLAVGASFLPGEWAVLNNTGTLERAPAAPTNVSPVTMLYLVIAGTDRFDVAANKAATIVMASNIIVRTKKYNTAGVYAVGTLLTVKEYAAGKSDVTPVGAGEPVVARVIEVGTDYLVYETL